MSMGAYTAYSSLKAFAGFLRGESPLQPTYVNEGPRRIRRSLGDLGESIVRGWEDVARGAYSGALVCYAATIGEFHPLIPVIDAWRERHPDAPIVVLSGQLQYVKAIGLAYPDAAVGVLPPCAPWLYQRLFRLLRPKAVVLGEGPCLHLHFPIPFDLALPAACVSHKTPLVVVNATLHKLMVPSRLDRIEAAAFGHLYLQALRQWYTPNEIFKSWLVKAGAAPERIMVTGDLRFDGLKRIGHLSPELGELLGHLKQVAAPIVVAGSVNAIDEEAPVVDGWLRVRQSHPGARLVMAPRHVNNAANMAKLYAYLDERKVKYARRSEGLERAKDADAIVVDVFGELPHLYSVASIAYIGRNHGVLEPLRFEVPTVVAPRTDWGADYVTYPAYIHMINQNAIIEAQDKSNLGDIFMRILSEPVYGRSFVANALRVAASERGAGQRIAEHLDRIVG